MNAIKPESNIANQNKQVIEQVGNTVAKNQNLKANITTATFTPTSRVEQQIAFNNTQPQPQPQPTDTVSFVKPQTQQQTQSQSPTIQISTKAQEPQKGFLSGLLEKASQGLNTIKISFDSTPTQPQASSGGGSQTAGAPSSQTPAITVSLKSNTGGFPTFNASGSMPQTKATA